MEDDIIIESESEKDTQPSTSAKSPISPQIRSIVLFLLLCQFIFNVSDVGMSLFIVFVYNLLKLFDSIGGNNVTAAWLVQFPCTLQAVRNHIFDNDINFTEYVVCPKCHSLYDKDDCVVKTGSIQSSKKCQYVEFPNHRMSSCRKQCGTVLMCTTVKGSRVNFKPYKLYV